MVDFRYHLVSLISVFLALAIGIVFGTTALNGTVLDDLRRRVDVQAKEKAALHDSLDKAEGTIAHDKKWATATAPGLLAGDLTNERVVVFAVPGVKQGARDGVATMLSLAGAHPVAAIRLTDRWSSPGAADQIATLAGSLQASCVPPPATVNPGPAIRLLADLAAAVSPACDRAADLPLSPDNTALVPDATGRVLSALSSAGLIKVDGRASGARLAIVLLPAADPSLSAEETTARVAPWIALVTELAARCRVVVAAAPIDDAGSHGALAALRQAPDLRTTSTVDDVDAPQGQVAVVKALVAGLRGLFGRWGNQAGDDGPLPTPSPTP